MAKRLFGFLAHRHLTRLVQTMTMLRTWCNWLQSMQSRTQPNATVGHGSSHAIVCIMAAQSYWRGKRLYWDHNNEKITEQPV
jgi:hypothetical protein